MASLSRDRLVDILKALADPNRLQLFELLMTSDQSNSELMNQTGLSQNLLSHHLSVLTAAGLIRAHQSIGDARRRYYSPNFDAPQCVAAWWQQQGLGGTGPCPALKERVSVLFLCRQNATRSLVAEALARTLAPDALIPYSAGIDAGPLPAIALEGLAVCGIPTDGLAPKSYRDLPVRSFDYLITVCDRVHEPRLPDELSYRHSLHWSLLDPETAGGPPQEQIAAVCALCDEIEQRLSVFVCRLAASEA